MATSLLTLEQRYSEAAPSNTTHALTPRLVESWPAESVSAILKGIVVAHILAGVKLAVFLYKIHQFQTSSSRPSHMLTDIRAGLGNVLGDDVFWCCSTILILLYSDPTFTHANTKDQLMLVHQDCALS